MTVLGIDTSNREMLLSLFEDDKILATYMSSEQKNHSKTLMPAIEFLHVSNNRHPKDLTKIVVAKGPGSYTGLRIAVTTAKTLAWTLGIDLYSVSSLAIIAASQPAISGLIVPVINARRDNVYSGVYQWQNSQLELVIKDKFISLDLWIQQLKKLEKPILFVGRDVSLVKEAIEKKNESKFSFPEYQSSDVLRGDSFLIAEKQWENIEDINGFVPSYLKKVEAEEKWLETIQGDEAIRYVERI